MHSTTYMIHWHHASGYGDSIPETSIWGHALIEVLFCLRARESTASPNLPQIAMNLDLTTIIS